MPPRGVVFDIVEAERELFRLNVASKDTKGHLSHLVHLSPMEYDSVLNKNMPINSLMPDPDSFVHSAIYPPLNMKEEHYKMQHLTSW